MMTIREMQPVDIATVQVDDAFRVELTQIKKAWAYSPDQARKVGNALIATAARAEAEHDADADARRDRMEAATIRTDAGEVVL